MLALLIPGVHMGGGVAPVVDDRKQRRFFGDRFLTAFRKRFG